MTEQRVTLDGALRRIREAYEEILRESPSQESRATEDELMERLARHLALDADGAVLLDDGSRLHVGPERGDRGEETGRIGVVQRFPDGRPERIHLVTP